MYATCQRFLSLDLLVVSVSAFCSILFYPSSSSSQSYFTPSFPSITSTQVNSTVASILVLWTHPPSCALVGQVTTHVHTLFNILLDLGKYYSYCIEKNTRLIWTVKWKLLGMCVSEYVHKGGASREVGKRGCVRWAADCLTCHCSCLHTFTCSPFLLLVLVVFGKYRERKWAILTATYLQRNNMLKRFL